MATPLANPPVLYERHWKRTYPEEIRAPRPLRLWHLASLDAPTVAVVWALAFAWAAHMHLPSWIPVVLACGTWTVYVGDRLLDARSAISANRLDRLRERHYFHWRQRRILAVLAICSGAVAGTLIFRLMPAVLQERNSVLGAAALAYFSGVHSSARLPAWMRRLVSKELLVGTIFTAGCAAPTLWHIRMFSLPLVSCFMFFAALAWTNCFAIEHWESGAQGSRVLITTLVLACAGLIASGLAFAGPRISLLFLAGSFSAMLLALLDLRRTRLAPVALRALADFVLLTPAILVAAGAINA